MKVLFLLETGITDAGLRRLERLSQLESLNLQDCPNVTDEGVARLQKALPKCEIRLGAWTDLTLATCERLVSCGGVTC